MPWRSPFAVAEDRNTWTCAQCGQVCGAGGRRTRAAEDRNFLGIIGLLICAAPGGPGRHDGRGPALEILTGEPSVHNRPEGDIHLTGLTQLRGSPWVGPIRTS